MVRGALVFVLVVLVGLGRRRSRRDTRRVSEVTRSIRGIPMAVLELTSAGGLNVGQDDRFVIVQVVDEFGVRGAKGVATGFEGGQKDCLEHIVDGNFVYAREGHASIVLLT